MHSETVKFRKCQRKCKPSGIFFSSLLGS